MVLDVEMDCRVALNYAFSHACRVGEINMVKYFIDKGCDVNFCRDGGDPLSEAVAANHIEITRLLLENGANLIRIEPGYEGNFHVMEITENEPKFKEMHQLLSSYDV